MTLRELGEEKLLARIAVSGSKSRQVVGGVRDDCAVLKTAAKGWLLLKTDAVVEGVHFRASASAAGVGWKAMMRPLSDIAAMAGQPQFALITLALPGKTDVSWVTSLYRGLRRAAVRFGVEIVGGETTAIAGGRVISVSVAGRVDAGRCVFRSGGKVDDALFVTGRLGGSIAGRHLKFTPRIEEARWLAAHFDVHAMMDLSDGLAADLPRLARASGVGYSLQLARVPRSRGCTVEEALNDGEDYELLFALPSDEVARLEKAWPRKFPRLPLTRIGNLVRAGKNRSQTLRGGYDHFRQPE
ncbi:MAG: thiamine-phosphate kinase [Verrucomicrobiota bacterium]